VQQGSSPELYIRGSSDASGVISWGSWFKALHTGNGSTAGSATSGYLRYAGTTKTAGQFDGGTTAPSNTTRLNYDGNFYATNFYGNGSNLTGIVSPVANSVSVTDSRAVATTPQTINQSVVFDFKQNTTEGLSDGGTYFGEMTFRQYGSSTDWTGGRSHQLGFTDNDNIWHRSGTSTTWGTWYKILHTGNFTLHARPARETVQVISANTNAVSGTTYILTASLTLTLPSSPTSGDYINISNRSGTTSAVIARNGSNIMSLAENMTLDVINASFKLVYADATRGWTVI
jgi:hypothetical protein